MIQKKKSHDFLENWRQPTPATPRTQCHRYRCSLPGLAELTDLCHKGTNADHH